MELGFYEVARGRMSDLSLKWLDSGNPMLDGLGMLHPEGLVGKQLI